MIANKEGGVFPRGSDHFLRRLPPRWNAASIDELDAAGADWQMVFFGGAVHGFTNPENGKDNSKGLAYNERAVRRSWEAMKAKLAAPSRSCPSGTPVRST